MSKDSDSGLPAPVPWPETVSGTFSSRSCGPVAREVWIDIPDERGSSLIARAATSLRAHVGPDPFHIGLLILVPVILLSVLAMNAQLAAERGAKGAAQAEVQALQRKYEALLENVSARPPAQEPADVRTVDEDSSGLVAGAPPLWVPED